jgi:hypothetical protein
MNPKYRITYEHHKTKEILIRYSYTMSKEEIKERLENANLFLIKIEEL